MTIASEVERLQGAKEGLKTAIENKGVEVDSTATLDEYPAYIDQLSAGDVVNGVVEQFLSSGEDIEANTFVEFVSKAGEGVELVSTASSGNFISAVALDDSRVFIAYHAAANILYGAIATLSSDSIVIGTSVVLATGNNYGTSAVKIKDNVIFLATNISGQLCGVACAISGSAITLKTSVTNMAAAKTETRNNSTTTIALDETRVLVVYGSPQLYATMLVASVLDGSITIGKLSSGTSYGQTVSATLLAPNRVLIAYTNAPGNAYTKVYGQLCTVSGTSVALGTRQDLTTTTRLYNAYYISAVALDTERVLIACTAGSELYVSVCTVTGSDIAVESETTISTSVDYPISMIKIRPNETYIAYVTNSGVVMGATCRVVGVVVAYNSEQLSSSRTSNNDVSATLMSNGNIFVGYTNPDQHLSGIVVQQCVQPSAATIGGLTKDLITSTTPGDVWILSGGS